MRLRLRAHGAADVDTVWRRYAEPALWSTWAPQIRSVESEPELRAGMRGRVRPVVGPSVRFLVTDVDDAARTWCWRVQAGPVRMELGHTVDSDGRPGAATELTVEGPALVVLAYAPLARRALRNLVRP
ncbi:SRPBCC family protein [Streptomyces sp. VRA16 Mangrove soil]|uniref:SRPBCC family protein n=1 Tax=Streptomyces sp. VRA16 Mangrove soil TaxID=2817434 RepID=UPI001A9CDE14|nr:SRPBCC family protein [Streptomyces sp. VRA16 Mangrove soil]MBO1330680.1 SRPBCC family protein [Streptomyces sp. VRA16 Mangrove soil]